MLKAVVSLILCAVTFSVSYAFPPAPGVVVYGLVRDADGQIVGGANAFVVFKSGGVEVARVNLRAGLVPTENYRALLPGDMNSGSDSYKSGVLDAAVPFTVQVEIGGQTFDPIESSAGLDAPSVPGSAVRFDFTLGTDSDGDGLPDEWEYWQLQSSGVVIGSELYNLDQFYADGDYDEDGLSDREEYEAGTFAYLGFSTLSFKVLDLSFSGALGLEFLAVQNRSYQFEGSSDLVHWEPIEVWFYSYNAGELLGSYEATGTHVQSISIRGEDVARLSYFRLKVE